jgi:hypothetical protein
MDSTEIPVYGQQENSAYIPERVIAGGLEVAVVKLALGQRKRPLQKKNAPQSALRRIMNCRVMIGYNETGSQNGNPGYVHH